MSKQVETSRKLQGKSEIVLQRVQWLFDLGFRLDQVLAWGLDRDMPDLGFQVLANDLLRQRTSGHAG